MTEDEARALAFDLLARRAWSRKELEARLVRRGATAAIARAVAGRLVELGYLDDAAFARDWVDQRSRQGATGPRRLREELRRKGVDAEVSGEAVAGLDPAAVQAQANRFAAARLARARRGAADGRAAGRRVAAAMARRGFDWDVIRAALRAAGEDADPEGDPDPDPGDDRQT